ncbi:phage tail sheath subtilisin-like domain-containing protein [Roseomonas sp. USHLN139]|uniref:phage tail sheath subtilisin-like domain-containing protein n=1 Tax=Roseomonas sp. USHLN139 TaxID=3081298 RepID=UPI003B02BA99
MVSFRDIPQNLRVPLFYAELDPSRANSGATTMRALIIGQQLAAGTYAAGTPVLMEGVDAVKAAAGAGSMLALMAEWYRKRDSFGEVYLLPLADPGAGAAAAGSAIINSVPTSPGTLNLYIAGQRVQLLVSPSQTVAQIATALAAAINALADLPVTAAASTGTVTMTAKHKGLAAGAIDLRLNYLGAAGGETTPAGLSVTLAPISGGTTNPSVDAALANLSDQEFDVIVFPYTDTGSLTSIRTFMAARWAWDKMLYGHAFAGFRGTLGESTTFGLALNDPHLTVMPANGSPTPPWLWAANAAGAFAASLRADVGLPLHGLPLDVLAPPLASRWSIAERNVLLWDGLSSFSVAGDGTVTTETIVTTYQRNAAGVPDDSYLYVERGYVLAAVIRDLRAFVTSTYGRFKLASDTTAYRPGARIITPAVIEDALLGRYRELERQGLVQEYETFRAALVVERDGTNRCRVNGLLPVVPIDQFRVFAGLVQFRNAQEV